MGVDPPSDDAGDLAYAPNISWLLPEFPPGERPRALALAGFEAIELGFPSAVDLAAIEAAQQEFGLEVVLFNQDVPVWDRWHRGYLSDPNGREEFRRRLDEALAVAQRLRAHKLMLPAGVQLPGVDRRAQHDLIVENLREAAPIAGQAGLMLTIEVINPLDHPGYFLDSTREAMEVLREVDHPSVRLQFDSYHLRVLEEPLEETFAAHAAGIGHVQFGDYPARCQPGTGTIDFPGLLQTVRRSGYRGYIGLEFVPLQVGLQALAWVPPGMRSRGASAAAAESERRP
jgi:hydroxypyruvate isomerase